LLTIAQGESGTARTAAITSTKLPTHRATRTPWTRRHSPSPTSR
jgi:hypothetical protein